MKARDVMTSPAITVGPDAPISAVAELLLANRISAVPVVGPDGDILGIVSEGDLLRRTESQTERRRPQWLELLLDQNVKAADFVKTHGRLVSDVMTTEVHTVGPDAELSDVATLLEERRIKRVPVVENGRIIGIVSRANLLHAIVAFGAKAPPARSPDDKQIREKVSAAARQSGAELGRVNIVVQDGVVYLWGTVKSENQRRALIVAAETVPGVRRVEDRLHQDWFAASSG